MGSFRPPSRTMADPALPSDLARLRPLLLRFARLHLRDGALAEDAVQETLLAALEGAARFNGGSSLATWVVGILRHKIADQLRRRGREVSATDAEGIEDFDGLFAADGHWREPPAAWGDPQRQLEDRRFMAVLEACLEKLPERLARIFTLREVLEFGTEEICRELGLTPNHCYVQLYRARMGLRECLQLNWFGQGPGPAEAPPC